MKKILRLFVIILGALMSANLSAEPFFFIQLSDPQLGMFNKDKDFKQDTINFEFAVATVNRLRPAFVIITGDLINKPGDAAQNAEYQRIVGKIDSTIPVYNVVGNHDIENVPTPATIAAYTNIYGPDYYTFRHKGFVGVVLNSTIIHSPRNTTNELAKQESWLKAELDRLQKEVRHVVVFQHHPWFLKSANEPDEYFNIPGVRRSTYLELFHKSGIKFLFSGHYHRNAIARDGSLEAVTTGPVGMPLGDAKSGLRIVTVKDDGIEHRFYHFGEIPNRIELHRGAKGKD